MCCLCSDRVSADRVAVEVAGFFRVVEGTMPIDANLAIASRVLVNIAQSRDAYHQISDLKIGPDAMVALVSDFIDESIDYARTFHVHNAAIDINAIRRIYITLAKSFQLVEIEISNTVSVALLAFADVVLGEFKSEEIDGVIESHVALFNAEKDAYADPDNYGAGFDGD